MTSALLNNLNTTSTEFSSPEKTSDIACSTNNFSQILDLQTKKTNNNAQSSDNKSLQQISNENLNENVQNISEKVADTSNNVQDISTILNEVLQEVTSELPIDFSIVQENNVISNIENTDIFQKENTTIINNETSQETITNEDSTTMQKEQILTPTPENLLTLNLIHPNFRSMNSINSDDNNSDGQNNSNCTNINIEIKNDAVSLLKEFKAVQDVQKNTIIVEDLPENDCSVTKTNSHKLSDIVDENIIEDLNIESVETSFGSEQQDSSDIMQNQTPQEQGLKAVIQENVKFDDAIKISTQLKTSQTELSAGKIIEQISKQMENMYNGSKVNIVLNPEALGKVALQIINSKDGLLAQFTVNNPDVKDMLMKGLANLKESLIAQGVSVDNVTVKLADSGDSEYQGDWTDRENPRGGFKEQNAKHQKKDEKQFEKMMFKIENDGNV